MATRLHIYAAKMHMLMSPCFERVYNTIDQCPAELSHTSAAFACLLSRPVRYTHNSPRQDKMEESSDRWRTMFWQ